MWLLDSTTTTDRPTDRHSYNFMVAIKLYALNKSTLTLCVYGYWLYLLLLLLLHACACLLPLAALPDNDGAGDYEREKRKRKQQHHHDRIFPESNLPTKRQWAIGSFWWFLRRYGQPDADLGTIHSGNVFLLCTDSVLHRLSGLVGRDMGDGGWGRCRCGRWDMKTQLLKKWQMIKFSIFYSNEQKRRSKIK